MTADSNAVFRIPLALRVKYGPTEAMEMAVAKIRGAYFEMMRDLAGETVVVSIAMEPPGNDANWSDPNAS